MCGVRQSLVSLHREHPNREIGHSLASFRPIFEIQSPSDSDFSLPLGRTLDYCVRSIEAVGSVERFAYEGEMRRQTADPNARHRRLFRCNVAQWSDFKGNWIQTSPSLWCLAYISTESL